MNQSVSQMRVLNPRMNNQQDGQFNQLPYAEGSVGDYNRWSNQYGEGLIPAFTDNRELGLGGRQSTARTHIPYIQGLVGTYNRWGNQYGQGLTPSYLDGRESLVQ